MEICIEVFDYLLTPAAGVGRTFSNDTCEYLVKSFRDFVPEAVISNSSKFKSLRYIS